MKKPFPVHAFTGLLLLISLSISARQGFPEQADSLPNAEPPHAYYTIDFHRHIPINPTIQTNTALLLYEFTYSDRWNGSQVLACFSGIDTSFQFLINGFLLSEGQRSILPVEFNITPFLKSGSNTIEIRCDHVANSLGRIPEPEASLLIREPFHVRDVEISSHPGKSPSETLLRVRLYLQNFLTHQEGPRTLAMMLSDSTGKTVISHTKLLDVPLSFRQQTEITFDHTMEEVNHWSPGNPYLYKLQLHMVEHGKLLGELLELKFGIREFHFQDSSLVFGQDTLIPRFADPATLHELIDEPEEVILKYFSVNGYNALKTNASIPVRIMDLFDTNGILVFRKAASSIPNPDRLDINRPSVIWIK